MTLAQELAAWPHEWIAELIARVQPQDVENALVRIRAGEEATLADLAALLSPPARMRLESMACEAQRLTRWHFGRTIQLYAPIYISNVCAADCLYCSFAARSQSKEKRVTLTPDEIHRECRALASKGFDSVLLLTGEAPRAVTVDDLEKAVAIAHEHFDSVSVEVFAMEADDYARLCRQGLEGVTLYMETYDPETYARVHPAGVKRDYDFRLDALDRAGAAGVRRLNLGALLGLFDWRTEGFRMGLHARHLQRQCWQSAVAVSFPRLRHVPKRFEVPAPVADAALVQLMLAMRLFLPEAGLVLSTRESAAFRDHLIPLGITMMSAGSSTRPGGYGTCAENTLEQFEVEDVRAPEDVVKAITVAGYEPVWKDFDRAFIRPD